MEPLFTPDEVKKLERSHPEGVSVASVVQLLRERGVSLAEATFRKYVQLGLLPRSRRVGRKGKHRGSHGLYPVACVARVAEIRSLMDAGVTLEELRHSSLAYANEVDAVRSAADMVLTRLESEVNGRAVVSAAALRRLQALRTQSTQLAEALAEATRELCPTALPDTTAAKTIDHPTRDERGRRPATKAAAARVGRRSPGARPGQKK